MAAPTTVDEYMAALPAERRAGKMRSSAKSARNVTGIRMVRIVSISRRAYPRVERMFHPQLWTLTTESAGPYGPFQESAERRACFDQHASG